MNILNRSTYCLLSLALTILTMDSSDLRAQEFSLPRTLRLGEPVDTLRPLFEEDCQQTETLNYTGAMAAPFDAQTQVNCSGLEVFGKRRDVEFMFNDGPLGHVWVHTTAAEAEALALELSRAFGPVVFETDLDRVFETGTVALRKMPTEILIATPQLITDLTGYRPKQ